MKLPGLRVDDVLNQHDGHICLSVCRPPAQRALSGPAPTETVAHFQHQPALHFTSLTLLSFSLFSSVSLTPHDFLCWCPTSSCCCPLVLRYIQMNEWFADYLLICWQSRVAIGSFYISSRCWCRADFGKDISDAERGCSVRRRWTVKVSLHPLVLHSVLWFSLQTEKPHQVWLLNSQCCQAAAGVLLFQDWHSREGLDISHRNMDSIIGISSHSTGKRANLSIFFHFTENGKIISVNVCVFENLLFLFDIVTV